MTCDPCPFGCKVCNDMTRNYPNQGFTAPVVNCNTCSDGFDHEDPIQLVNPAGGNVGNAQQKTCGTCSGPGGPGTGAAYAESVFPGKNCAAINCDAIPASPGAAPPVGVDASCVGCASQFFLNPYELSVLDANAPGGPGPNPNYNPCVASTSCPAGHFADTRAHEATANQNDWAGVCTPCGPECTECSGIEPSNCAANTCNAGWFWTSPTDGGCVACDPKCATCAGPSNTLCTACR